MTKNDYTKSLDIPRRFWYAHPMSMKIFEKGNFVPSVALRQGETVFDLDGFLRRVSVPGAGWWIDSTGFQHIGGAIEAVDVTDHPVVRCNVVDALKEKGAL